MAPTEIDELAPIGSGHTEYMPTVPSEVTRSNAPLNVIVPSGHTDRALAVPSGRAPPTPSFTTTRPSTGYAQTAYAVRLHAEDPLRNALVCTVFVPGNTSSNVAPPCA